MILLRKISLWLALVGILGIILLARRTNSQPPMPDLPAPAPAKPAGTLIGALGIVESFDKNVRIAPPVAGLVNSVHIEPWSNVKTGDVLFEIDARELRSQLPPAEAEIAVRTTERDNARRLQSLAEKLQAAGSASAEELEERRDQLRVTEARLAAAAATLEQIRAAIDLRTVHAPTDGTVLQVNIRPGEFLSPGANPPAVLLGDTARLQVRVDVDEQLAPRLRPGMDATGYLKGDATTPIPMTFERIEPYVVPKQNLSGSSMERVDTRVLQVIYSFPQRPERPIYVGQQINLFIAE